MMPADRAAALAYLRTAPLADIRDLIAEARVCDGWRYWDDEWQLIHIDDDDDDDVPHWATLETLAGTRAATLNCETLAGHLHLPEGSPLVRLTAESREQAERAIEDAVIAAGYRVPWRHTICATCGRPPATAEDDAAWFAHGQGQSTPPGWPTPDGEHLCWREVLALRSWQEEARILLATVDAERAGPCPICDAPEDHAPDCALARLLEGEEDPWVGASACRKEQL